MNWVCCNKCGCQLNKRKIFITTCSHFCCEACLKPADQCPICKVSTKSLEIGPKLPPHVMNMFRIPKDIAGDVYKNMSRVLNFQKFHKDRSSLLEKKKVARKRDQIMKMVEKYKDISSKNQKLLKARDDTIKKFNEKKQELAKLENILQKETERIRKLESVQNFEDFLLSNTPSVSSCPSVSSSCSSKNDNDNFTDFDLLGFNFERKSSNSSLSSVRADEPLF